MPGFRATEMTQLRLEVKPKPESEPKTKPKMKSAGGDVAPFWREEYGQDSLWFLQSCGRVCCRRGRERHSVWASFSSIYRAPEAESALFLSAEWRACWAVCPVASAAALAGPHAWHYQMPGDVNEWDWAVADALALP